VKLGVYLNAQQPAADDPPDFGEGRVGD